MKTKSGIIEASMRHNKLMLFAVLALCVFGVFALVKIPKQEFPTFTVRQGVIVGVYPGATSAQMEEQLAKPLEQFLFTYKEIRREKTYTMSRNGIVYAMVELEESVTNKDEVWSKIKHGLTTFKATLPTGVLAVIANDDFGDTSALLIAMESDIHSYREMEDLLDDLENRLRRIKSVSNLRRYGIQKEQISIYVDNKRMAAYGLDYKMIASQLFTQGFTTVSGTIETPDRDFPVYVAPVFDSEFEVGQHILYSDPTGNIIRLKDIAEIVREYPTPDSYIKNNGKAAILLSLEMRDGNNIIEYGREVDRILAAFQAEIPDDITLTRIADQPKVVEESVTSFLRDLVIAIIMVILTLMVFFPFRTAVIVSTTIPIAVFISIGIMYIFGIPLNTVTLAALIVVLGMIVDNSIVVVDSYIEYLDRGMSRWHAAVLSAKNYVAPIFLATLCICVIFVPLLIILTGIWKDFVRDFPWAMTISMMTSFVLAMVYIPFFEYLIIKKGNLNKEGTGKKKRFDLLTPVQRIYTKVLGWTFKHPWITISSAAITVIVSTIFLLQHDRRMFPYADRDQFAVEIFLPVGSSLAATSEIADSVYNVLMQDVRVRFITQFTGTSSPRFQTTYAPNPGGKNFAQFIVNTASPEATIQLLDEYSSRYEDYFPNAFVKFKQLDYQMAQVPFEVRFYGNNTDDLKRCADKLVDELHNVDHLIWIRTDSGQPLPGVEVNLNPVEASRLGVSRMLLQSEIAASFGGVPVSTVWEGSYGMPLVLHLNESNNIRAVNELGDQYVSAGIPGMKVPLRQIAEFEPTWNEGQIVRRNGVETRTVMANIERGASETFTFRAISKIMNEQIIPGMPESVSFEYGGMAESDDEIIPLIIQVIAVAVCLIFVFLVFNFKRVDVAAAALISLVFCLPGTWLGLLCTGTVFGLTCVLGIISLMGIIMRNAIIMFDHAENLRINQQLPAKEAAFDAGRRRMVPIFLTTMTTALGIIPMILSNSTLWTPMGIVIFFGSLISLMMVVTVLPAMYWKIFSKVKTKTNRHMKHSISIIILLLFPAVGFAQKQYTLGECERMALEQNHKLKNATLEINAASQTRKEAFTAYFPQVSATGAWFNANKGMLRTKVDIPADISAAMPDIPSTIPLSFLDHGVVGAVTATQPVFAGGRIVMGNKLAKIGEDVANVRLQLSRDEVILATQRYYFQLTQLHEQLKTLVSMETLLLNIQKDVSVSVQAGLTNRNDLLRVELQLQELESNKLTVEHNIRIMKLLLQQHTGIENDNFNIQLENTPADCSPHGYYVDPHQAIQQRKEMKLLDYNVSASRLMTKMEGAERLPSVAVGAGYVHHDLLKKSTNTAVVYATVSIPISDWWGKSHARKKYAFKAQQAENDKQNATELMIVEISKVWNELIESYHQIRLAEKSIESSNENLRLNKDFYRSGTVSMNDLLDAQVIYQQSCNQLSTARCNYIVKLSEYKIITGQAD